jgi:hypothetical protein
MGAQITVTLPEGVLRRAELWAQRTGRPVEDLLAETIAWSLEPLGHPGASERPIAAWPDEEVLAAADADMPAAADEQLSQLLGRQQAGVLSNAERADLAALMQIYQEGLLRKAQALREAVRRNLREPLQP